MLESGHKFCSTFFKRLGHYLWAGTRPPDLAGKVIIRVRNLNKGNNRDILEKDGFKFRNIYMFIYRCIHMYAYRCFYMFLYKIIYIFKVQKLAGH